MSHEIIKSGINLYAILKNLEDLVKYDKKTQELIKGKNVSIQFIVNKAQKAWVSFKDGTCKVGQGKIPGANVKLWFKNPAHLNAMFDGKSNPIPLKGFRHLGFLSKEFTEVTKRLEYYLRPELVENPNADYVRLNTMFSMTVASFALPEIAKYDSKAKITSSHLPDGKVQLKVMPDGPAVYLLIKDGSIKAHKGEYSSPDAILSMKDMQTANDFLNGKLNAFTAIALGDVAIKGMTPILDGISLILGKVQDYV